MNFYQPSFDSDVCSLIVEISRLRARLEESSFDNPLLSDLKPIFTICESVASARIEGNRTTVAEYVNSVRKREATLFTRNSFKEIRNLVNAMEWIEETIYDNKITEAYIRHLQKLAVQGIDPEIGDGDRTPGEYRKGEVALLNSKHRPPNAGDIPCLMRELVEWINEPAKTQYSLLNIALAHWRLVWIHPFNNGNGRTTRLLMFALLVKKEFIGKGLFLNPNVLCCARRSEYYSCLADADKAFEKIKTDPTASRKGFDDWCLFVLNGLKQEIESAIRLSNVAFVVKEIIIPSLQKAKLYDLLTEREHLIATEALGREKVRLSDFSDKETWKSLKKKELLVSVGPNNRSPYYRFSIGKVLYPYIVERFVALNLIPISL